MSGLTSIPKDFSSGLFYEPPSFCYPGYFWFWNDTLEPNKLAAQLRDMHQHKANSVCPQPLPREFRTGTMASHMAPEYLSDEYFRIYDRMIREAARLGMDVWLYDEGGWPSGSACGRVVQKHPELLQKVLRRRNGTYHVEPAQEKEEEFPKPPYPDVLNPKTAQTFLSLTHERYRKAVGRHFGSTIRKTFTDEPKTRGVIPGQEIPWTEGIAKAFRKEKGYDSHAYRAALFGNPRGDMTAAEQHARVDFFDFWSKRLSRSFLEKLRTWCRRNGLLSGGHMAGEELTIWALRAGFGQLLRCLRMMDVPGVDTIWREIFPGKQNHHFPKFASSAAHQNGSRWSLTESFAVYGSGLTPEQMKWIVDYQYVRGINLCVPACYPLSPKGRFLLSVRPQFGPANPLWDYMDQFHTYTARLGYLLSLGKPVITHALYYPARDLWAAGPSLKGKIRAYDSLAQKLLASQCDYDLIDDDILESRRARVKDGALHFGDMTYRTIWMPPVDWLSEGAQKALTSFIKNGGTVKALHHPPRSGGLNGKTLKGAEIVAARDIANQAGPLVRISRGRRGLRVCARKLRSGGLFFLTNESRGKIVTTATFPEKRPAYFLDPLTGACWKAAAKCSNGQCEVKLCIAPSESRVLFFTNRRLAASDPPPQPGAVLREIDRGWQSRPTRSFRITGNGIRVSTVRQRLRWTKPGDWGPLWGREFSGDVEYVVRWRADADTAGRAAYLDMGRVCYACSATLNGRHLGRKAWPPFLFEIEGLVKKGMNRLSVTVTNTPANQYVFSSVIKQMRKEFPVDPYHDIALKFEKESMESGLFGPVRIMGRQ